MFTTLWKNGLWRQNPLLVQCLGLCPLLAVSTTLAYALALGLATTVVLIASNVLVSLLAPRLSQDLRLPVFIVLIATLVSITEILFQAWWYEMYQTIGLFLPLIVSNCLILGRAEAFASHHPLKPALIDACAYALGFLWVLLALGAIREWLAFGSFAHSLHLLLGVDEANGLSPVRFLLPILPPGVFLLLGLMIAGWRMMQRKSHHNAATIPLKNC